MGKRITIDPITRIEGHLRIEIEVEGGRSGSSTVQRWILRVAGTLPGSRGGDSRTVGNPNGGEMPEGSKPREGRQSRERQATLGGSNTLKWGGQVRLRLRPQTTGGEAR
jgi:hypothetical protein